MPLGNAVDRDWEIPEGSFNDIDGKIPKASEITSFNDEDWGNPEKSGVRLKPQAIAVSYAEILIEQSKEASRKWEEEINNLESKNTGKYAVVFNQEDWTIEPKLPKKTILGVEIKGLLSQMEPTQLGIPLTQEETAQWDNIIQERVASEQTYPTQLPPPDNKATTIPPIGFLQQPPSPYPPELIEQAAQPSTINETPIPLLIHKVEDPRTIFQKIRDKVKHILHLE